MMTFKAVNRVTFFPVLKCVWSFGAMTLVCLVVAGCDRKAAEPEAAGEPLPEAAEETVETVEIVTAAGDEAEPSAVLIESRVVPMSPESVPGRYQDPAAPDVVYEFGDDMTWQATWQPGDASRGLLMEGVYQVESGGVVHLRVLAFGRREEFIGDDWDRRSPPHPRPRGYFRIEGNELVMMSDKTAQAFTMAPFNAARLVKVE